MKTKVIKVEDEQLLVDDLNICMAAIADSGVIAIPTDTVYGLACNVFDPVAVKKVYELKGRDYKKPLPVLLESHRQLELVTPSVSKEAQTLVGRYWPGPLTIVFKTAPVVLHATRGKETIAVRVPDHGLVTQLLKKSPVPLAATSANKSGEEALTSGDEVIQAFINKVNVIVDAGECEIGTVSSVVDATHYPFTLLREGTVSKQELYKSIH